MTVLSALQSLGGKTLFWLVPNKTIAQQIRNEFPDVKVALGRNEHPCLYYRPDTSTLTKEKVEELYLDPTNPRADQIPCLFLQDCPHRVDQQTGETYEEGAYPCPYYQQKFEAKKGGIVLATMSFYLFTRLFSKEFPQPDGLVIDEVHRLADVVRNSLSYEITDYHIGKMIELLRRIKSTQSRPLARFLRSMKLIAKSKKAVGKQVLLKDDDVEKLIGSLQQVDGKTIVSEMRQAIRQGIVDKVVDRDLLKKLETVSMSIRRYIHSLEYCLSGPNDNPLNYVCAFYEKEIADGKRVQYKLVIKCFYVNGLVKAMLGKFNLGLSATIGDKHVFECDSGLKGPMLSVPSPFSAKNSRMYMPLDTPNLAVSKDPKGQRKAGVIKRMVRAAQYFAKKGHRSLFVVVSNEERQLILNESAKIGFNALSYGNGVTAKDTAIRFRNGDGDGLVGTEVNYGEGIDLPNQIAPIIWVLRPGYPPVDDPLTQFEERRFGNRRWARWNWKVTIKAMQVRGRNIRSKKDVGVTFFVSQQFRNFVHASLPADLAKHSYNGDLKFDEAIKDACEFLTAAQ